MKHKKVAHKDDLDSNSLQEPFDSLEEIEEYEEADEINLQLRNFNH